MGQNTLYSSKLDDALIPTGTLRNLNLNEIRPSLNNPRQLFDEEPLRELLESIKEHGVLVPITVYPLRGQNKFAILDGERRYRCCLKLEEQGHSIKIPANIVDPPTKIANMLYMFSIHNLREQWDLMPTALSLKIIMSELNESDTNKLSRLTGLSESQVERCKILVEFPEEFQNLSLDPDPKTRIPTNLWIEAFPVINLIEKKLPKIASDIGRDGITRILVEKYRTKKLSSVIHFRRIMEANAMTEGTDKEKQFIEKLQSYLLDPLLETRETFDEFVLDSKRIQTAVNACDDFVIKLDRAKLDYALEKKDLIISLKKVKLYIEDLLEKLAGEDPSFIESDENKVGGEGN